MFMTTVKFFDHTLRAVIFLYFRFFTYFTIIWTKLLELVLKIMYLIISPRPNYCFCYSWTVILGNMLSNLLLKRETWSMATYHILLNREHIWAVGHFIFDRQTSFLLKSPQNAYIRKQRDIDFVQSSRTNFTILRIYESTRLCNIPLWT